MPLEENCLKDDTHTKEPLRASDRPARASLPPSLRAGMSLEAAIAVPLFLFFVMNLLFVFDSIRLQSGLQAALQQAGEQICEAAYYTRYGNGDGAAADIAEQSGAASFVFSETFICFLAAFLCCRRTGRTVLCRIEDHDGRGPRRDRGQLQDQTLYPGRGHSGFPDAVTVLRACLGGMDAGERPASGQRCAGPVCGLCDQIRRGVSQGSGLHLSQPADQGGACIPDLRTEERRRVQVLSLRVLQAGQEQYRLFNKGRKPIPLGPQLQRHRETYLQDEQRRGGGSLQALLCLRRHTLERTEGRGKEAWLKRS